MVTVRGLIKRLDDSRKGLTFNVQVYLAPPGVYGSRNDNIILRGAKNYTADIKNSAVESASFLNNLLWADKKNYRSIELRFKLDSSEINFSDLDGRSADLAFAMGYALTYVERYLPNKKQFEIVATGAISKDGRVEPIGGINEKIRAALDALPSGSIIFYPEGNRAEIESDVHNKAKEKKVELFSVNTLIDALRGIGIVISDTYTGNPYRGLDVFDFEHAPIFFGRSKEIKDFSSKLLSRVKSDNPNILLVGASGSGKSSIVFAGVMPLLVNGIVDLCEESNLPRITNCLWSKWRPRDAELKIDESININSEKTIQKANDSVDQIELLIQSIINSWVQIKGIDVKRLKKENPTDCSSLLKSLRNVLPSDNGDDKSQFIWVIDQQEELYTSDYLPATIDWLSDFIIQFNKAGYWLISTLRIDFFGQFKGSDLSRAFDDGAITTLDSIDPEAIEHIIEEPAKRVGVTFELDKGEISLAKRIKADFGKEVDALPMLEFTLSKLYDQRDKKTHEIKKGAYKAITLEDKGGEKGGGLKDVIAHEAEKIYQGLKKEQQQCLPNVIWELVKVRYSEEIPVSKPALLESFTSDSKSIELINIFTKAKLFVQEQVGGNNKQGNSRQNSIQFRIIHETLLSHWPRVEKIINIRIKDFQLIDRLNLEAKMWKKGGILLPKGLLLIEAKELKKRYKLKKDVCEFIDKSTQKVLKIERKRKNKIAVTVFVLITLLVLITFAYSNAEKKATEANDYLQQSNKNLAKIFKNKGSAALEQGLIDQAAIFLSASAITLKDDIQIKFKLSHVLNLLDTKSRVLQGHANSITVMAYSPENEVLASGSADTSVKLWDTKNNFKLLNSLGHHQSGITALKFSEDGQKLLIGSADWTATLIQLDNGNIKTNSKPVFFEGHHGPIISTGFTQAGKVVTHSMDGTIKIWNEGDNTRPLHILRDNNISEMAISSDGKLIAALLDTGEVYIYLAESPEISIQLKHPTKIKTLLWNKKRPIQLGIGDIKGVVSVFSIFQDHEQLIVKDNISWRAHLHAIKKLYFYTGDAIISTSINNDLSFWKQIDSKYQGQWSIHSDFNINNLSFNTHSRQIALGLDNGLVQVLQNNGHFINRGNEEYQNISDLFYLKKSNQLVIAGDAFDITVNKIPIPFQRKVIVKSTKSLDVAQFNPSKSQLLVAGKNSSLKLIDTNQLDNDKWSIADLSKGGVSHAQFDSTGNIIIAAHGSQASVWNTATKDLLWSSPILKEPLWVGYATFIDKQRVLLAIRSSADGIKIKGPTWQLWDIENDKLIQNGSSGCDFDKKSAENENEKHALIASFKNEFESKKDQCRLLIIGLLSSPDKFIVAGFNDKGNFQTVLIDQEHRQLSKELKSLEPNKKEIIKLATSKIDRKWTDPIIEILKIKTSHDGKLLLTLHGTFAKLFRTASSDYRRLLKNITVADYHPFSDQLITGSLNGDVKLLNYDGQEIEKLNSKHEAAISAIKYSPDGMRIVSISKNDETIPFQLWDSNKYQAINISGKTTNEMWQDITWSSNSQLFALGSSKGQIEIRSAKYGERLAQLNAGSHVNKMIFNNDNSTLSAITSDGEVIIWTLPNNQGGSHLFSNNKHIDTYKKIMNNQYFFNDDLQLAIENLSQSLLSKETVALEKMRTLMMERKSIEAIDFSKQFVNKKELDNELKLMTWHAEVRYKALHSHFRRGSSGFNSINYNASGRLLASIATDGAINIYDTVSKSLKFTLDHNKKVVWDSVFSPTQNILASRGFFNSPVIWDLNTGKQKYELEGHTGRIGELHFNKNGSLLISGSRDATARVWDVNTGQSIAVLKSSENHSYITDVLLSPNGEIAYTGGSKRPIEMWNVKTEKRIKISQKNIPLTANKFSLSKSGKYFASGHSEGRVYVWNVTTGEQVFFFSDSDKGVDTEFVEFSPVNENILLTGSPDKLILRSIVKDNNEPIVLELNSTHFINRIKFSSEGDEVIAVSNNGMVFIWSVPTGKLKSSFQLDQSDIRLAVSPVNKIFSTVGKRGNIFNWDRKKISSNLPNLPVPVRLDAIRIDNETAFIQTDKKTIKVFDANSHDFLYSIKSINDIKSFLFSQDKKQLIALVDSNQEKKDKQYLKTWSIEDNSAKVLNTKSCVNNTRIETVVPALNLCISMVEGQVTAYDISTGKKKWSYSRERENITKEQKIPQIISILSTKKFIAVFWVNGKIDILNTQDGSFIKKFKASGVYSALSIESDKPYLMASDALSNKIILWDMEADTGSKPIHQFYGHSAPIKKIFFNKSFNKMYSLSGDGYVYIWDIKTGLRLATIGDELFVPHIMEIIKSEELVITADNSSVRLSSSITGKLILDFKLSDVPNKVIVNNHKIFIIGNNYIQTINISSD